MLSLQTFGVAKMVLCALYQFFDHGRLHGIDARGAALHGP